MNASKDIYKSVADKIIESLEKGVRPWVKPWNVNSTVYDFRFPLRACGKHYHGINILLLLMAQADGHYTSNRWATFKQVKALGGSVLKGEHGTHICFYKSLNIKETDPDTLEEHEKTIPMLRDYVVFNADQTAGLPDRFYTKPSEADIVKPLCHLQRHGGAESLLSEASERLGVPIHHNGGNSAFYRPGTDSIHLPEFEAFKTSEGYYSTAFHELGHSTGHKSRLDRKLLGCFGSGDYAEEELVAELTSAFVCVHTGVLTEPREDHAAYLKSWLDNLKKEPRYIFRAASAASKAADLILGIKETEETEEKSE